jgi:hypothetical protein
MGRELGTGRIFLDVLHSANAAVGDRAFVFTPPRPVADEDFHLKIYDYIAAQNSWIIYSGNSDNFGTNIFTAGAVDETLTQVRVYVYSAPQNNVPVFLTKNLTDNTQIADTIAANAPIATFDANYIGFHTIHIPPGYIIDANSRFAISIPIPNPICAIAIKAPAPQAGRSFTGTALVPTRADISAQGRAVDIKAVTLPALPIVKPVKWLSLTANGVAHTTTTTEITLVFEEDIELANNDVTVTGANINQGTLIKDDDRTYRLPVSGTFTQGAVATVSVRHNGILVPAIRTVNLHRHMPVSEVTFNGIFLNNNRGTPNTEDTTVFWLTFNQDPGLQQGHVTATGATVTQVGRSGGPVNFQQQDIFGNWGATQTNIHLYFVAISDITVKQGELVTLHITNPSGRNITPVSASHPVNRNMNTTINWLSAVANGSSGLTTTTEIMLEFNRGIELDITQLSASGAGVEYLIPANNRLSAYRLGINNITVANGENITLSINNTTGFNITPLNRNAVVYVGKNEPVITLAPAVINFGTAVFGYDALTPRSVVVNNIGNAPTGALTVTLNGTNPDAFTLSTTNLAGISPGGNRAFTVVPNTGLVTGSYSAVVTVSGGGLSESLSIGFSVAPVAITQAGVTITPPSLHAIPNDTAGLTAPHYTASAVTWSPVPTGGLFQHNTVYTATVTLTANPGYTFHGLPLATVNGNNVNIAQNTGNTIRFSFTFPVTTSLIINNPSVTVVAPVAGAVRVTTATMGGVGYTLHSLTWSPSHYPFHPGTVYTVTVVLNAAAGYTFTGMVGDAFINGEPATITSNIGNRLTFSHTFPITAPPIIIEDAAITVPVPVPGMLTPNVNTILVSGIGFSRGTVTWSPDHSPRQFETVYTVTVTLNATLLHTFNGMTGSVTVNGQPATNIVNNGSSLVVSFTFPPTVALQVINHPQVTVTAPVVGNTPSTVVTLGGAGYSAEIDGYRLNTGSSVRWLTLTGQTFPIFQNMQQYTVTIVLTRTNNLFTFTGMTGASINNEPATVVSNDGSFVTLSFTFPPTGVVPPTPINTATVSVTAPLAGTTPDATSTALAGQNFTRGTVSWSPDHTVFQHNTAYTATLTLTAASGHTFTGLASAAINGQSASISNNTGSTVRLSYQFPATAGLPATVTELTVKTQPTQLIYNENEMLNLTGLVATLTYSDSTEEDIALVNFNAWGITASPANSTVLTNAHHETPITLTHTNSGMTANTGLLTVNAAPVKSITAMDITFSERTTPPPGTGYIVSITGAHLTSSDIITFTIQGLPSNVTALPDNARIINGILSPITIGIGSTFTVSISLNGVSVDLNTITLTLNGTPLGAIPNPLELTLTHTGLGVVTH